MDLLNWGLKSILTKIYDIILVVSDRKTIVTIYVNAKDDNHLTLKKELYVSC